jgi:hypothetical protein
VDQTLGAPVVEARTQSGGMSPGAAARLRLADGRHAFVKTVGSELNPNTPALFRHEIGVLRALPAAAYRPELIGTYDDGDWVAILLEDIPGRHPEPPDEGAVLAVVREQAVELTPPPVTVLTLADRARSRWLVRWPEVAAYPDRYLPEWLAPRAAECAARVESLPDRLDVTTLCHWDVRDDNVLVRPDGSVVIFDWGMSCLGPRWADEFCFAIALAEPERAPELLARIETTYDVAPDLLTDLLLGLVGLLVWGAQQPPPPGLPTMPAFRAAEAKRFLDLLRPRLQQIGGA